MINIIIELISTSTAQCTNSNLNHCKFCDIKLFTESFELDFNTQTMLCNVSLSNKQSDRVSFHVMCYNEII